MANAEAAADRPSGIGTGRLEAFSDGVFAIAITLLVLEITVPTGSEADLWGAITDQWRSYLAYAVSFATIGALWLAHSVITEYLGRANALLVRLNLLLLMVVVVHPLPHPAARRVRRRRRRRPGRDHDLRRHRLHRRSC